MSQKQGDESMLPPPPSITEAENSTTQTKGKGGKPRSTVWDHFTTFQDSDGAKKAKCNYCGNIYCSNTKKNGTSSLWNHLTACRKHPCSLDVKQQQLSLKPIQEGQGECMSGDLTNWRFDQEFCRKKLDEMIIKDELPFKLVEGEGFKEFVAALQPRFMIPSRWTISRDCYQLYLDEKMRLKNFFVKSGQSVSITTDTWTSLQKLNYMCITVHYIDENWKLNKKIINFCTIESHKGDIMGRQLDGCLREWGIARVFSVTVDNASSNDTCLSTLKNKLASRNCCLVKGRFLHMRCVAHIVALVVGDGLKEMNPSIKKIRDVVRYVRQSPARHARFVECCKDENIDCKSLLCLDVPTRWNSTYLMLNVACKFDKAFEQYEVRDPFFKIELDNCLPEFVDWENARRLNKVLKLFYELTIRISGSLYITSNTFFHEITNMSYLLKEWVKNGDLDVRGMGKKMKEKFDKYWGDPKKMNMVIFFGVVIDPRYKFDFLQYMLIEEYGQEDGTDMSTNVKQSLYELYDEYKKLNQIASNATQGEDLFDGPSSTPYVLVDKYKKQKRETGEEATNDLDVFLTEKERTAHKQLNFDILDWWKLNSLRLPILSHIARDILSVPISTVASESAFSAGGRVLDPFRSSLTPKIVESLICTQDWLRKSRPISIEEDLEGLQKHEEALKSIGISGASGASAPSDADGSTMDMET